jgi:hypothetical protein
MSGSPYMAAQQLAVHDRRSANARAQRQHDDVVQTSSRAEPYLTQQRSVRVV